MTCARRHLGWAAAASRGQARAALGLSLALLTLLPAGASAEPAGRRDTDPGWVRIFNGRNLDGWTPKFAGHAVGENYRNAFRVENGLLKVSYDQYEQPQLDPADADAQKLLHGADRLLSEGYIALQAETHPTEFRKVELLVLPDDE